MSDSRSIRFFSLNHQWLARFTVVALVGVIATQTGCNILRSFDQAAAITYRDLVWSKRAYNLRYGNCERPYAEHFRNGFCDGYSDVCQGGDGYTPALPPDNYRGYEFQSADGSNCVDAWFEGYPAGVAAARKDNSGNFHDLAVSRLLESAIKQEKSKPKVTGEVPVVTGKKVVGEDKPFDFKALQYRFVLVTRRYQMKYLRCFPEILKSNGKRRHSWCQPVSHQVLRHSNWTDQYLSDPRLTGLSKFG